MSIPPSPINPSIAHPQKAVTAVSTTREVSRDVSVKQEEIDDLTERVERVSSVEIVSRGEIEALRAKIAMRASTVSSEEGAPLKHLKDAGVGVAGEFASSKVECWNAS
jgi:hypothetical protein